MNVNTKKSGTNLFSFLWQNRSVPIFLICLLLAGCSHLPMAEVCMNGVCLKASVASSDSTRKTGLMFRKELPENQAMLFVFDQEAPYGFWMKNMFIPLDIIWVSRDKEIVDIHTKVLPCQEDPCPIITPRSPAKYVVEVNAGFTEKHQIKIGDKIRLEGSYD